jgi:membrane protein
MLWRYLTAVAIILGAELDAELERQTPHDTTRGPDQPIAHGTRRRPTLGPTAEEVRAK